MNSKTHLENGPSLSRGFNNNKNNNNSADSFSKSKLSNNIKAGGIY